MLGVLLATVALVGECSIPSCKGRAPPALVVLSQLKVEACSPRVSDTDCWVSRGYLSKAPEVIYILATRPTGASTPGEPQMGRTDVRRGLVILALVATGCACPRHGVMRGWMQGALEATTDLAYAGLPI